MTKQLGFYALLVGIALSMPTTGFAQTTTGTLDSLLATIASLQKQVIALQTQLATLQKQTNDAVQEVRELVRNMAIGAEGEDVRALQLLLAADPEIYPEGLFTGYFGPLTAKAVKKFQEKNGIEQVGFVGPKTLKKLNEKLKNSSVIVVGDGQTITASTTCTVLPPGHYIAPGWNKKMNDDDDDDEDEDEDDDNGKKNKNKGAKLGTIPFTIPCGQLPPGIAKKINWGTTTPPVVDTTAPIILSTSVTDISTTSARVNWTTNEATRAQIAYGTSTSYTVETGWSAGANTNHSHLITGLTANTVYYFRVRVKDAAGNVTTGPDQTFTTTPVAPTDTVAPIILSTSVVDISTTSARVNWTTNEAAHAQIAYGTTTSYTTETGWSTGTNVNHSYLITGLSASTTYHFRIQVKDAAGNVTTGSDQTFTTSAVPPPADTTAPVISGISAGSIASTTASISWTTNENATSKVYYGTATPLNLGTASYIADSSLVTSHMKALSGLTASTTHYYVVESQDGAGNTATSTENSFMTLP